MGVQLTEGDCLARVFRTIDVIIPSRNLNLGPKRLSLLEFETWQIGPLGHYCQVLNTYIMFKKYLLIKVFLDRNIVD